MRVWRYGLLRDGRGLKRMTAALSSFVIDHALGRTAHPLVQPKHTSWAAAHLLRAMDVLRQELEGLRRREQRQQATIDRLNNEIRAAGVVQNSLLHASSVPSIEGLNVHWFHQPAHEVSGDCHDLIPIDEHRTAFVLADATGHDLPAAMLATYVHRALRDSCGASGKATSHDPVAALNRLNNELWAAQLENGQFVAALYAIFDLRTRTVRWVRAGVPYPVLIRKGIAPRSVTSRGTILGVTAHPGLEVVEVRLEPGDTLLFFTDGVESTAIDGEISPDLKGDLCANWLRHMARRPASVNWTDWCRQYFSHETPDRREDDVTIVAIEMPTSPKPANPPHAAAPGSVEVYPRRDPDNAQIARRG